MKSGWINRQRSGSGGKPKPTALQAFGAALLMTACVATLAWATVGGAAAFAAAVLFIAGLAVGSALDSRD